MFVGTSTWAYDFINPTIKIRKNLDNILLYIFGFFLIPPLLMFN